MPTSSRGMGPTPWSTSLAPGSDAGCPGHPGFPSEGGDTAHTLTGEGTLSGAAESNHSAGRIISNPRVPVFAPDGEPLMPTKASRARRWIREGKAKPVRTRLGIFAVQLTCEPSGRDKQPIVLGIDPGSKYTGMAVASAKAILYSYNLELPDNIKERMAKRSERRRNRRYRKCRRRKCRFLNRTGHKIAPSIISTQAAGTVRRTRTRKGVSNKRDKGGGCSI